MLAIKRIYHESAVDLASAFDDLPDHLCVELEFMHLLGFREDEADDQTLVDVLRTRQAFFIDRFMQPFIDRLATLALRFDRNNPYAQLVEATRLLLAHHRAEIGAPASASAAQKGRSS
jgi:TorA maturation chaperone TorD